MNFEFNSKLYNTIPISIEQADEMFYDAIVKNTDKIVYNAADHSKHRPADILNYMIAYIGAVGFDDLCMTDKLCKELQDGLEYSIDALIPGIFMYIKGSVFYKIYRAMLINFEGLSALIPIPYKQRIVYSTVMRCALIYEYPTVTKWNLEYDGVHCPKNIFDGPNPELQLEYILKNQQTALNTSKEIFDLVFDELANIKKYMHIDYDAEYIFNTIRERKLISDSAFKNRFSELEKGIKDYFSYFKIFYQRNEHGYSRLTYDNFLALVDSAMLINKDRPINSNSEICRIVYQEFQFLKYIAGVQVLTRPSDIFPEMQLKGVE